MKLIPISVKISGKFLIGLVILDYKLLSFSNITKLIFRSPHVFGSKHVLFHLWTFRSQDLFYSFTLFFVGGVRDRLTLRSLGCSGTPSVDLAGLKLIEIHLSLPLKYWD